MNKKKILVLAMTLSMVAILAIGGTIAYFTDKEEATNVFTIGNVDIILEEPNWVGTGSTDAPEVYPGEALAKDPTVINDGANPCFVRIEVEGLDCLKPADDIIYRTDYVDNELGDDWVKHTDGYYYYTKVLAAGETTDALFDQIVIPKNLENYKEDGEGSGIGEDAPEYQIDITAYAVQAQGARPSFSAVQAMTVAEIAAWFTTCGF